MSALSQAEPAPATMTRAGRRFLQALTRRAGNGSILEIGPLFGSSTQAIAAGRRTEAPIHTIDTFQPAPWIERRLGRNLSREAFNEYTSHIPRLVVHEGFAPDVVRDTWTEDIGLFFDDATHGDPGWSANFDFFSPFFTEDAIVCGDDFAGGWPDIPRNVTRIAESWNVGVYVIGRVWAMTRRDEDRIVAAVDEVYPELSGAVIESDYGEGFDAKPAACWSRGLHRRAPLSSFRYSGDVLADVTFDTHAADGTVHGRYAAGDDVDLNGVSEISLTSSQDLRVQYCLADRSKTENSKLMKSGATFHVPREAEIVAVRLSTRYPSE